MKYLIAGVLSLFCASSALAQETHTYWRSLTDTDTTQAFTWVGARDGELGEYPTEEGSPGILHVIYTPINDEECAAQVEVTMHEYFYTFEHMQLIVGGDQVFDLQRFTEEAETPETRARIAETDVSAVLATLAPAQVAVLRVIDWDGDVLYENDFSALGYLASTSAAEESCVDNASDTNL